MTRSTVTNDENAAATAAVTTEQTDEERLAEMKAQVS